MLVSMIKQCGNILGSKPAPTSYTSKGLTMLAKKRKRARKQRAYKCSRARRAYVRRRASKTTPKKRRRRRRRKTRLNARRAPQARLTPRSESTSVQDSDSDSESSFKRTRKSAPKEKADNASVSNKRPCRRRAREKNNETTKQSMSESFQKSIPASKYISFDAYQAAVEKWNSDMTQAQLEAQGVGGAAFPPPGSKS